MYITEDGNPLGSVAEAGNVTQFHDSGATGLQTGPALSFDEVLIVNPISGHERRKVMLGKTTRSGRLASRHRPGSGEVMLGKGGQLMEVYADRSMAPCQYVTIGEDGGLQAVAPLNTPPGIAGRRGATLRRVSRVTRGKSGQLYESLHGRMRPLGGELVAGDDGQLYELTGLAYPVGQRFIQDPARSGKVVTPPGAQTQTPETQVKNITNVEKRRKGTTATLTGRRSQLRGYENEEDLDGSMYFDDDLEGARSDEEFQMEEELNAEDYEGDMEFEDAEFDEEELSQDDINALQAESDFQAEDLEGALNADELEGFVQVPFVQEDKEVAVTGAIRPTDAPKGQKGTIFESYF